jgi:hypothetical protein
MRSMYNFTRYVLLFLEKLKHSIMYNGIEQSDVYMCNMYTSFALIRIHIYYVYMLIRLVFKGHRGLLKWVLSI